MAVKRMFSSSVTETDSFLELPLKSQALYFHLGMQGDDDLDEIPPEVADTLARGCLRLYYQIIAMPNGRELLDDALEKYQQRKKAEVASPSADSSSE